LSVAAKRYATALAEIALEEGVFERVGRQLEEFLRLTRESDELKNLLANPAVERESKHGAVEEIAARMGASKVLRNFLLVLVDHDRTPLLPEIQKAFHELILERLGVAEAEVTSPAQLTPKQKRELSAALERLTGKKIEARYDLDPALLGGAVVRIGSTIYDGSVRAQLERLRARLAAA
jgi:F-type H+-transporting ATPase subunit delta